VNSLNKLIILFALVASIEEVFLYVKLLGVAGSRAVVALIALNVLTTHAEATWWALETIATIAIRLIETHRAD